jgi:phosphoribosylformylglycinamidine cyclo-ligase
MPKDDPELLEQIIQGVTAGCLDCDCALLGGETAILPDVYSPGDYDLAGFCVGVVEKDGIIDGRAIAPGDVVLGIPSSGLHSNGYSLARKVVFDVAGHKATDHIHELGRTVGEALMEPTRIYVRPLRRVLGHYRVKNVVHGIAHITGGGILENVERILPPKTQVVIDRSSWPVPPIFTWIQRLGEIEQAEMDRVFNLGIGMVLIVSAYYSESIREQLTESGLQSCLIGFVREGPQGVVWGG